MDKVIVIAGSTGTGKSALAIALAKAIGGEVISGDSMQVYKGMDIGTAKIMPDQMEGIPHHLLDIQNLDVPYDAAAFQSHCRKAISDIISRGKAPIICGGTGFYLKAALYDYDFSAQTDLPDPAWASMDNESLHSLLKSQDPVSAEKIHPNNRKRVLRALAISQTGMSKSQREAAQMHAPLYDVLWIGLRAPHLTEALEKRIEKMMDAGLEEEVRRLFSNPETWTYTSFQGIGYKEWQPYLEGTCSLEDVKESILVHTRQYARRQRTWFAHQMPMTWYDAGDRSRIIADCREWYFGNK